MNYQKKVQNKDFEVSRSTLNIELTTLINCRPIKWKIQKQIRDRIPIIISQRSKQKHMMDNYGPQTTSGKRYRGRDGSEM